MHRTVFARPLRPLCLGALCAWATAAALAAPDAQPSPTPSEGKWLWQAPIELPAPLPAGDPNTGFVQLPLSPRVLDEAQGSMADLRVVGPDSQPRPHLVRMTARHAGTHIAWRSVPIVHPVYQPGQYARATLDFGEPTLKSEVKVSVSGTNFRRRAQAEGSADGEAWDRLGEDQYLFAIDLPGRSIRVDTLRLLRNDFRYLRLTVYAMPGGSDDGGRIEIESAQSAFHETAEGPRTELPHAPATVTHNERTHETAVALDLGARHLMIEAVRFAVRDPFFHRAYVLEGRDSTTETLTVHSETAGEPRVRETPWIRLREGVLYRIANDAGKTAESLEVDTIALTSRYLRLRIFDQDDPPLDVDPGAVVVWWRQPMLVFQSAHAPADPAGNTPAGAPPASAEAKPLPTGGDFALCWGNPAARAPQYDLAKTHAGLLIASLPTATLGEPRRLEAKPAPKAAPLSERHSGWMLGLLVVAAAGLAAFATHKLRALRRTGGTR